MVVIFGSWYGAVQRGWLSIGSAGPGRNHAFTSPGVVRRESRSADLRLGKADFCDGSLRSRREILDADSGGVSGQHV